MVVLLVMMYNKMAISLTFHEVGGLIVCGLFLIHKLLNLDWIIDISKKLFTKSLPAKTRFCYIVDILLLISIIFIALSGILISKVILIDISSHNQKWKQGHYFASALAIVLTSIHIGLHWSFIKSMFAKVLRIPRAITKPLGIAILAVVIVFGGYSLTTSSFTRWISGPLTILSADSGESHEGIGGGEFNGNQYGRTDSEGLSGQGGRGLRVRGNHQANHEIDFTQVLSIIATYGSIIAVFTALTVLLDGLLKKIRAKRNLSVDPSC